MDGDSFFLIVPEKFKRMKMFLLFSHRKAKKESKDLVFLKKVTFLSVEVIFLLKKTYYEYLSPLLSLLVSVQRLTFGSTFFLQECSGHWRDTSGLSRDDCVSSVCHSCEHCVPDRTGRYISGPG